MPTDSQGGSGSQQAYQNYLLGLGSVSGAPPVPPVPQGSKAKPNYQTNARPQDYYSGQGSHGQNLQVPNHAPQATGRALGGLNPSVYNAYQDSDQHPNPATTYLANYTTGSNQHPPHANHTKQPQAYAQSAHSNNPTVSGEMSSEQLSGMYRRKQHEEQAGIIPPWETPTSSHYSRWESSEQTEAMKAGLAQEHTASWNQGRALPGFGRGFMRGRPGNSGMRPGNSGMRGVRGMSGTRGMNVIRGRSGRRGTTGMRRDAGVNELRANVPKMQEPNSIPTRRTDHATPRGMARGRGSGSIIRPSYQAATTYIGYNKELVRAKMVNPTVQRSNRTDQVLVGARQVGKAGLAAGVKVVNERKKVPVTMSVINKDGVEVVHLLDDSDTKDSKVGTKENAVDDIVDDIVDVDGAVAKACKPNIQSEVLARKGEAPPKCQSDMQAATNTANAIGAETDSKPKVPQAGLDTPRSLIKKRLDSPEIVEHSQSKEKSEPEDQKKR